MSARVLITGASGGIGSAAMRELRARGAEVVGLDLEADEAAGVIACDVTDDASVERAVAAAIGRLGGLDVLINNAGISMQARFDQITDLSTFEKVMRINFFGAMWCTHAALPALKRSRGLVVGMSSLAGKTGIPGRTAYCASKFAMSGFFEALRIELLEAGVGVTMLFPGVVATELRRNGLNGSGERAGVSGLKESDAMSVERCAALAIAGMRARRRDVIMTGRGRLVLKLKPFAPDLIDRLANPGP